MNTEPGEREETPRPIGWQTAQIAFDNPRMVKVVFETPECAEAFIDGIEPADGPIVAATRMRERCVARVRELRDEWYERMEQADEDSAVYMVMSSRSYGADKIIVALESLTLDGEKE